MQSNYDKETSRLLKIAVEKKVNIQQFYTAKGNFRTFDFREHMRDLILDGVADRQA